MRGPASSEPAHRLGVALRRLGTIMGIKSVRAEEEIRQENHGGDPVGLTAKMEARTAEIEKIVKLSEEGL